MAGLAQAWNRRGLRAWLLWPISLLYGLAVAVRRWQFKEGIQDTWRMPVCVIVVGNVVAGGAGKTPVVMALVRHLQARGLKVGVVSRGYGRSTQDCREVRADSVVQEVGDEPALIQRATGAPVFVAIKRVEAAQALLKKHPDTQVIVADDGLQHYALQRDLEICVFDDRGIGNGFLLPAGPLREPWPRSALQSKTSKTHPSGDLLWPLIDTLLLHSGEQPAFLNGVTGGFTITRTLASYAVRADGSTVALSELRNQPLLAVAAIAQPEQFFNMLRAQGLTLARTVALPDHYDFDSWMRSLNEGYSLVCTEKDAVKLWRTHPDALAVPLEVVLEPGCLDAVNTTVDATLAKLSFPHGHTTS
jgi:tetraacyldisaccharide 4'-kinase